MLQGKPVKRCKASARSVSPCQTSEPNHPAPRGDARPLRCLGHNRRGVNGNGPSGDPDRPERSKLPRSRSFKVAGALLGFLACLAALVVLIILIWPPSSVALVLVGADYADNLMIPHNILGWKGIEAIDALARTPPPWALFQPARFKPIGMIHKIDRPDDWDKLIKDLVKSRFEQQTIVIVLALHGGSDSEGAYLCPDRMAGPEERLDLSHVIKSMAELPPEKAEDPGAGSDAGSVELASRHVT